MDANPNRLRALVLAITTAALLGCGSPGAGTPPSGAARTDQSAACARAHAGPLVATVADRVVLAFPPADAIKTGIVALDRAWCPDLTASLPTIEQIARAVLATKTSAELSTAPGRERAEQEIRDRVEDVAGRRVAVAVHQAGGAVSPMGVVSRG